MARPVGVVGLGLMGGTMAAHLLEQGPVIGYDPDTDRTVEHEARGGTVADSVTAVVGRVEIVLLSLPNSEIMKSVCAEIVAAL